MESDPTRMCALLVGLPDVTVIGVGEWPHWLRIEVATVQDRPSCSCGTVAHRHGLREVLLVDLPCFCRPTRLVVHKQRWRCPTCRRSWTGQDPTIASSRCAMTTRAARWATRQVGKHGRAVSEVADDLGCDWHTVMDAVVLFGEPLIDDPARYATVTAVGLDETLYVREGPYRRQLWSTQVVDVQRGQLLDVLPARTWPRAAPGSRRGRPGGANASAGRRSTFPTATGRCSTRCSPRPSRSLTRSTSCAWETPRSMSAAGGCRTTRSATADATTIRSTALAAVW